MTLRRSLYNAHIGGTRSRGTLKSSPSLVYIALYLGWREYITTSMKSTSWERPNEVVHTDSLYMGPSNVDGLTEVFLIKNDLCSYARLHPCAIVDSEAAKNAILKWISCFGYMPWHVTDQRSHFTPSFMTKSTREMHIRYHFTTAYYLRANGTIERLCKEVLRVVLALSSKWNMPVTQ